MKYILNEIKGKEQGDMVVVEAETPQIAIDIIEKNWDVVEVIKPTERFSKMHFGGKMYIMYEYDKPANEKFVIYVKEKCYNNC